MVNTPNLRVLEQKVWDNFEKEGLLASILGEKEDKIHTYTRKRK